MTTEAKLGTNYTGAQMSPQDTQLMLEATDMFPADVPGNETALAAARELCVPESDRIGSVPIPGSAKGMLKTGFQQFGRAAVRCHDRQGQRIAGCQCRIAAGARADPLAGGGAHGHLA